MDARWTLVTDTVDHVEHQIRQIPAKLRVAGSKQSHSLACMAAFVMGFAMNVDGPLDPHTRQTTMITSTLRTPSTAVTQRRGSSLPAAT